MKITSPAFNNGEPIPVKYTCDGPNISPPLKFSDIPKGTQSMVLMVEDPDAPAKPWVHWLVFNIPPHVRSVEENSIPAGSTTGICNGGTFGYEGPCPPSNEHQYFFKLYALDTVLDIPKASDRKVILSEMEGHILDKATLTGKYQMQKVKERKFK